MINNTYIKIFLKIFLISFFIIFVFNLKSFAVETSSDIAKLDESKYPGYKELIQTIQKQNPTWKITLCYTGLNWNEVIISECQGHGTYPKNLVPANNSNYAGEWICPICGKNTFDTGSWYCASEDAIAYMMDPRNSINSSDIFQFQKLSKSDTDEKKDKELISNMLKNTFMNSEECINAIILASKTYDVNPLYIVARIIQEQGSKRINS